MQATLHERGQLVIPAGARKAAHINKGDVLHVTPEGDGRLVLIRVEKLRLAQPKIRLVRRKGKHAILAGGPRVTNRQVKEALAGLP